MPADPSIAAIVDADRRRIIHGTYPVDSKAEAGPVFKSGEGLRLETVDGADWLDGCAGQANVIFGYGRDDLAEVVAEATRELCYGAHIYQRRGHPQAALLAEKLVELTPGDLGTFFYGVGGSDIIDTAIKLARFVNVANGRPEKTRIIGRERSYHGVTYAAMSLTGNPQMWENFGPRLDGFSHIGQPGADEQGAAAALEREILRLGPDKVAAFVAEPISAPNGFVVPPDDYWPEVREICTRYEVLMIADEVLTGFGRTGRFFGIENWGVVPDMMALSKGLTAGHYPMSVLALGDRVVADLEASGAPVMHAFTSAGQPAGCAVARAVIEIIENEDVLSQASANGDYLRAQFNSLAARHPALRDASAGGIGMFVTVDVDTERAGSGFGSALQAQCLRNRAITRGYLGDQRFGVTPALNAPREEFDELLERIDRSLTETEAAAPGPC